MCRHRQLWCSRFIKYEFFSGFVYCDDVEAGHNPEAYELSNGAFGRRRDVSRTLDIRWLTMRKGRNPPVALLLRSVDTA
jgi:hypothetical protein